MKYFIKKNEVNFLRRLTKFNIFYGILFFLLITNVSLPVSLFITYQGRLNDGGVPANDSYDFQFTFYDDPTAGPQLQAPIEVPSVKVMNGLFAVELTVGPDVFDGKFVYLEIGVRGSSKAPSYTILTPRQKITSAPQSIFSYLSDNANYAGNADKLDNYHHTSFSKTDHNHWNASWSGDGNGLTLSSSNGYDIYAAGTGKIKSDAETVITANPYNAVRYYQFDVDINPKYGCCSFTPVTDGSQTVYIPVDLPIVKYGVPLKLKSATISYKVSNAGSYIDIAKVIWLTANGSSSIGIEDSTNRNSINWAHYTIQASTPYVVEGSIFLLFQFYFAGTGSNYEITIGQINLTLVQ